MTNRSLSILIPARNEMFLARTVEDILQNKRGNTEVIVGLDGVPADPPVIVHPDVTVVSSGVSLGQRAMTNQLCRLSSAKYVMKCDAHCAFDEGFDIKLMADMQDELTMLPMMYNLHAFDWVCKLCGNRTYQGPTPEKCFKEGCIGQVERQMIWEKRSGTGNYCYYFDTKYHFQYHTARKHHPENTSHLVETMSAQGSCFLLTRERYWKLNICDEEFGSWGQQGFEVAMKTWMSGGRLVSNKNTWYAHMFRTQGGDFGFPYKQSGKQIEHARKYSKELVEKGKWPHAIRTFDWLLEKFKPVPDWHDAVTPVVQKQEGEKPSRGILYYTNNKLNMRLAHDVRKQIERMGLPITSVSLKPLKFGHNIVVKAESGYKAMFTQILTGLEAMKEDIVYFTEHDVLYHPDHFKFIPKEHKYYYEGNYWVLRFTDGFAIRYDLSPLSGLVVYREDAIKHFRERLALIEKQGFGYYMGFEPFTHRRVKWETWFDFEIFMSEHASIDIAHGGNLTNKRWSQDKFIKKPKFWEEAHNYKIPGWDNLTDLLTLPRTEQV